MVFAAVRNVLALLLVAAVCDAANEVKVSTYNFNGFSLTGALSVQNLAFSKVVNVIYANNANTWGNVCAASYTSGPDSSNREVWSFNCPVGAGGITQFFVEYKVNGQTYYDNNGGFGNNYRVVATTSAPTPAPPLSPPGFQQDISDYLTAAVPSFKTSLLANVSPKNVAGAAPGSIIAATAGGANNYIYHWIRDAGLVMDVVNTLYKNGDKSLEQTFWDHAAFTKRIQATSTLTGLGEAKYFVNGGAFNDPWCRPQNDGPALRASSFIRFAKAYLANGGSMARVVDLYNGTATGVIKPDLEYISTRFNDASNCDLWEEIRGLHFFTMAVQRRALHEGRDFARMVGDVGAANYYAAQAAAVDTRIRAFYNANAQVVESTLNFRLLDAAIPLGAVHGNVGDGLFGPQDDRILSSIFQLGAGFIPEYTLNQRVRVDAAGLPLSVAIGRYYGDKYDGSANTLGNPWYLTTVIVAETAYRAATAYVKAGSLTVTPINQRLFNGPRPAGLGLNVATGTYAAGSATFKTVIDGLKTFGDLHIRRVKYHGAAGFRFNEQYNRDTGLSQGVNDLTWSYGAMLSANDARDELRALSP